MSEEERMRLGMHRVMTDMFDNLRHLGNPPDVAWLYVRNVALIELERLKPPSATEPRASAPDAE